MIRTCFAKWKQNRWKNWKRYSTQKEVPEIDESSIISRNIAISGHARSGQLYMARYLFDQMPERTVVSWNTMISGYSRWGKLDDSLSLLFTMHRTNTRLNETTFSTLLSVCAHSQSFWTGQQIHCLVLKSGCLTFEFVASALLYFYSKCLQIEDARRIFVELRHTNDLLWNLMLVGYVHCGFVVEAYDLFVKMPCRNVASWTALISGYAKREDCCERALDLFRWMRYTGEVVPNEFTLDCVARVCGRLGALIEGMGIHGLVVKYGYEPDQSLGGALIEFYRGCRAIDDAKRVYDGIINPCPSASNLLIEGFIAMDRIGDAELIFDRLNEKNAILYNLMIKGYAMSGRVEDSKKLFEKNPHKTIVSSNTMISVYSRNGEIDKAVMLFEEIKEERNPVTWNSMMSGYIQNNWHEEALKLFLTMRRLSVDWTRSTFSVLFHSCSCLGSLEQGQMLHANLIKSPFVSNVYVGTSLVDMYSKCGSIFYAQKSFSCIGSPNVAAWTALINGYAHHGLGCEAILLFDRMLEQKVAPNGASFVGILAACGRAGLVIHGLKIFHSMERKYGLIPTLEHYACVVDLLGRSGHLLEAEEFIKAMPMKEDGVIWAALLSACWFWRNIEVGERVAKIMFKLDPMPTSAYVILSNIYATSGKWGEKMNVRNRLRDLEVKKNPGCSWIEMNGKLHVFSVENRTHRHCSTILAVLDHLTANLISNFMFNSVSLLVTEDGYVNAKV